MTSEPAVCAECTSRGHIYQRDCPQCHARMIARTPRRIAAAWFESWKQNLESAEVEMMRKAIAMERELDQG